jgi:hypothetical protein
VLVVIIVSGKEVTFETAVLIITGWVFCVGQIMKVMTKQVHHTGGSNDRVQEGLWHIGFLAGESDTNTTGGTGVLLENRTRSRYKRTGMWLIWDICRMNTLE